MQNDSIPTIITNNGSPLPFKSFKFSGGEISVKLLTHKLQTVDAAKPFYIIAHLSSSDKVMELVMLTDALRREYGHNIRIVAEIPYLPYARQDRVCAPGEAFSLGVIAKIINSLNFEMVAVCDAHSDVSLALIDRVEHLPVHEIIKTKLFDNDFLHDDGHPTVLVAPDAGAIKKVLKIAQVTGLPMVRADKIRDVETGQIKETVVYSDHIGDSSFLIVDDICDGGRTFIELEKVLRPLTNAEVNLYVTHGIFSKGLDVLNCFDHIYTPFPFPNVDTTHPKLEVL